MTQANAIHVLIADSQELLRCGLSTFIGTCDDCLLVGEARDGAEAVGMCEQMQPDVVLIDVMMPDMGGITATRLIREQYPGTQVIALSSMADEKLVTAALEAGAVSYLLKNITVDVLAAAIRDAHMGKTTLAPEATQALVDAARRPRIPVQPLSKREGEVLHWMVKGQSNAEIAGHLGIGVSTVKKHVSSIFTKLQTGTRAEAVALAVRHALVDD